MSEERSRDYGAARLLIGLLQGAALLYCREVIAANAWPAAQAWVFAAFVLTAALAPLPVLAGLGQLRTSTLLIWTLASTAVLAGLAAHDVLRDADYRLAPSFPLFVFSAAGLFIAYHLVAAADAERRPIARYQTYFDIGWKNGVQLALSLAFTSAFWLLLYLGTALFALIGIDEVGDFLTDRWVAFPLTGLVFGAAVHLSDMRVGLIAGIRNVALTLLSWLLPVMAFLALAFLGTLPFVGLEPLWETRSATALLLSAAATLIILINATFQDGTAETTPHAVLRTAARLAAPALVVLVALAGFAVWLRVDQHGLTPDRIVVGALVLIAGAYAVGYAIAAAWLGAWFKPLEATNVVVAVLGLCVMGALLTPLADPARLAVDDQIKRLASGAVTPEAFDFNFLRFESGRYGLDALDRLTRDKSTPRAQAIAEKAQDTLHAVAHTRQMPEPPVQDLFARVVVYPKGATLPESFVKQDWSVESASLLWCLRDATTASPCEAFLIDFNEDGTPEILIARDFGNAAYRLADGKWGTIGSIDMGCGDVLASLRSGRFSLVKPRYAELQVGGNGGIGGQRARLYGCIPGDTGR